MSLEFFEKLCQNSLTEQNLFEHSGLLADASGNFLEVFGKTVVDVEVGGQVCSTPFLVTKHLPVSVLLGARFLVDNQCRLDFRTRRLYLSKNYTELMVSSEDLRLDDGLHLMFPDCVARFSKGYQHVRCRPNSKWSHVFVFFVA